MKEISKIQIRNAWSEGKDLVLLHKENQKRKKVRIKNYPWYFTIRKEDWIKHNLINNVYLLSIVNGGFVEYGEYYKLFFKGTGGKVNNNAKELIEAFKKSNIETFETDVHSAKRYMTDYPVEVSEEYDILYWDIETDDTTRKIEIGKYRILSIAAIDNNGNEFYFDGEEEELIRNFLKLVEKYDVIAGWNTDEFDLPYLKGMYGDDDKWINGRMELYKIKFDWYKVASIDMLKRARKVYKEDASLKSYSLENISQYFLGHGKVKFEGKVIDLYNSDKETFKKYNIQDVKLLKELDEKMGMIDLIAKECKMSKTLIRDFKGLYVSEVLDNMILREAHKQGIMAPSRKSGEHVDYAGGLVFEPKPGLYKNVYVFDFKSLYPSIILTSNIGFDSVVTNQEQYMNSITNPGTTIKFRKDKQSIIATVVERLVEERQIYKQKRLDLVTKGKMKSKEYEQARANEIIIKELSNSVYGIMGLQSMRYYSLETAESITKMGHWLLNFSRDFFEANGFNVIYGDTDSLFVQVDGHLHIEQIQEIYHKELELQLKKYNIDKSWIYFKYEKLFESVIMIGKKYYVGNVTNIEGQDVNEFVAKGLDLVKKATIPIMLESQKVIIDNILEGKSEEAIHLILKMYKTRMFEAEFTFDDLKIATRIGKDLNDYKQVNAPHVRIAKELALLNGNSENSEIAYVVVDDTQSPNTLAHRGTFTGEFDRTYYWNNKVLPGLIRVLEVVYPNTNWKDIYQIKKLSKKIAKNQLSLW